MMPLITFDDMNVADFLRISSHFSRSLCNSLIQRFAALSKEAWKSEGGGKTSLLMTLLYGIIW